MSRRLHDNNEKFIRVDAEGQVEFSGKLCGGDKTYPSGITIGVYESGSMIGFMIPSPTQAGDSLVRELHELLGNPIPKTWEELVQRKRQEWGQRFSQG